MTENTGHTRADGWAEKEHDIARSEGRGCWHCWGIAEGIAAQKRGHVLAHGTPLPEDTVWLGDLAGMEVVPVITIGPDGPEARLELRHRTCDDRWPIPEDGIAADGSAYVGNIAVQAREARDSHSCTVRERSAEHQARVARWLTAANLPHTGDPVRDQIALVRNIAQAVRPAGMTEAAMDAKLAQIARGDDGPADIPVRREVDGKWQTVMVTEAEYRAAEGADGRTAHRVPETPECTGPHQCGPHRIAYCRESCTKCMGDAVRPCFAPHGKTT